MKNLDRKHVLSSILSENDSQFLKVSDVRDELLSRTTSGDRDKSRVRRWVYSHFLTLEKRGLLEKQKIPGSSKWQYRLTGPADGDTSKLEVDTCEINESLTAIEDKLASSQRMSKIYLSELNAYKDLQTSHPALKEYAKSKYQELYKTSFELLGSIRAWETTLLDHGKEIRSCN